MIFSHLDRKILRMSLHKTLAVRFCSDKVPIIVIFDPDSIKSYIRIYTLFVPNRLNTVCLSQNVVKAFRPGKPLVHHLRSINIASS